MRCGPSQKAVLNRTPRAPVIMQRAVDTKRRPTSPDLWASKVLSSQAFSSGVQTGIGAGVPREIRPVVRRVGHLRDRSAVLVTGLRQIVRMVARTADGAMRTTRGAEQQSWAALQAMRSVTSSGRGVIMSLLEGNRLGGGVFVDALRISRPLCGCRRSQRRGTHCFR